MPNYYGWEAPTSLVYSNCSLAARWLAAFLSTDSDPRIMTTYDYLASLVPSDMDPPDIGQAIAWYGDQANNDTFMDNIINYPIQNCTIDVCEQLPWKGDADLAGVGVMVVYYLAAAFTSTYYIVHLIDQWFPFTRRKQLHRHWDWFASAFRESIMTFIDVALIFSISMLIAGVYRHGSSRLHPDKTNSLYQLTNATYMSIFSIFPPLLLQLAAHDLRRLRIRQGLWFIVIVLAVTITGLYFTLVDDENRLVKLMDRESATTGLIWEMDCDPANLRDALDYTMETADAVLGLNFFWWAFYTLPPSFRTHLCECVARNKRQKHSWINILQIVKLVDGMLSVMAMWALLAVFTAYRIEVESKMGESEDLEWSFSQVLSLTTWVPVVIDLLTIYVYGAIQALEGKVSERFEVVETPMQKSGNHIDQQNGENAVAMDYRLPRPVRSTQEPIYAMLGFGVGHNDRSRCKSW